MFNRNRTWSINNASEMTPELLAEHLTQHSWTLCTAFQRDRILYLNDSLSEDGAGEWAMVRVNRLGHDPAYEHDFEGTQFESVTFGWIDDVNHAADLIRSYDDSAQVESLAKQFGHDVSGNLHPAYERCPLCA